MKVETRELFSNDYTSQSLTVHFSVINDSVGIFIFYFVHNEDGELTVMQASDYFQLLYALNNLYFEGEEAEDIMKRVNIEEYWKMTYEEGYESDEELIRHYNEFRKNLEEEIEALGDEYLEDI